MMRFVQTLATAFVAISMAAAPATAQTDATPEARIVLAQAKKSSAPRHTGTQVYLLRGFMDIFSTGMDDLGAKLSRRGIRASVHNHSEFQNLANAIGERHQRGIRENVVIIGHSLGANDAFRMAERLNDFGITVPLIIAYDPTATMSVPRNVSRVVNFYSSTNGWGVAVARGPGFRGSLSNVDLSRRGEIGHTDIDKSRALHSQSIGYVQSISGSRSRSNTAKAAPKPSRQESSAKPSEKSDEVKTAAAKDGSADSADAKKESASTDEKISDETKSAAVKDAAGTKNGTAEKEESADKGSADKGSADNDAAAKAASAPAAKDATAETTASVPAKDTEAKESGKESSVAAKPPYGKTETAESKTAEPATSN
jgi:pimeloyl-ACP methyl ester carboxylesterase